MKKAHIIQILTIFFLLPTTWSHAQTGQTAIQQLVNTPALKHASVGICVKDFSGKTIIAHNENRSFTPASILKVVTTATALELLGEDYRYTTTLAKDDDHPNRLIVHGYGDPTLGTEFLDNTPNIFLSLWEDQIKQNMDPSKGLEIMVIDDHFGYDGISHRWIYQDIGNYYASGTYGISIFDNTYSLYLNTMRSDTCPVIVKTEPSVDINFKNTLRTNTSGQDNAYIHGIPFSKERLITGDVPSNRSSFRIKGDIPDPGLFLGEALSKRLSEAGFSIKNIGTTRDLFYKHSTKKEKYTFSENIFYEHFSFPIKDIIRDTNVRSNNHYAEHLIRTVGRIKNQDIYSSALDEGIEKTVAFWNTKGLETDALFMYDGSGLSPANAVSPAFMCDLLTYMQTKSKYAGSFLESLPRAGFDGTVKNRLKGTRLAGKVYMKSGSINGVQCFSGYYIDGEKKYAFTIMVNKFTGSRNQIVKAIDKLLLSLLKELPLVSISLVKSFENFGGEFEVFQSPIGSNQKILRRLRHESLYNEIRI